MIGLSSLEQQYKEKIKRNYFQTNKLKLNLKNVSP